LVKTGGGYLNLSSKVSGPGNIYLRDGMTTVLGDRTGQGAGRTISVEGRGSLVVADDAALGDYTVLLTKGGRLYADSASTIAHDITVGAGGGSFSGNGAMTLKGVIRSDYKVGTTVSFSGNVTLGGGATDTRPNEISTFSLINVSAPLILNKASGVQALAGDILLSGGSIKLLADEQMAPTVQIATISGTSIDLNGHAQTLSYLGTSSGSSVKLGTGGSLTLVGTNLNISALGSITGAGKVTMRSVGQTLKGADTFSGGLFVEGGVTSLQNARTITGGVTLRGGVMSASADNALGAAANAINFDGGTWSTAPLTTSAHAVNILAGGGTVDTGSTNLTLSGAIGGGAATGALHKRGTAQLTLNGDSNFAGRIVADAGTVTLGSTGRLLGQSALQSTPTGAVTINSPTSAIAADQIAATSILYAGGGTITYVNNSAAGANETTGAVLPSGGATTLAITNAQAGQAALTIGTFGPRGGGATVNFAATSLGVNSRFLIPDQADGFMGSWVLANGTGFAKYSAANGGVVAMDAADYAPDFGAPDAHVRISATPASVGTTSIASLSVNAVGAAAVNIGQDADATLTIASGGFYKDGAQAVNVGGGSLTATNELTVHASGGDVTISSAITGGIGLAKSGAGKLRLTGPTANTYTGSTYVNQGTLELAKTAVANSAVTGDVVVNGGTLRLAASEQIADTATVTLNSGTFDLNGFNETVANLANNGGTFTASGGRLTVLSEHTATLSSGATTIGAGQIIDATGLRITGGANAVAAGGLINVFRSTPDGEVSGGLTLSGADPAIALTGSGAAAAGTIALGGEVTVSATGVAKISTSGGTLPGQVNLRGARVFNVNSELEVSAKLYGGSVIKRGPATMRLNGSGNAADVSVEAGALEVTSASGLGTATAILNGGKLSLVGTSAGVAFTGNVALAKDGVIEMTRPLDNMSGSLTGAMSIGSLGIGANQLTVIGRNGGSLTFTGATTLTGNASFNTTVPVTLAGAVVQSGGSYGITKSGGIAPLILSGSTANTFSGPTTVSAGDVELRKSAGVNAVGGDLVLGAGANVRSYASHQIADAANVTIAAGATLDLLGSSDNVKTINVAAGGTLRSGVGKVGASDGFSVAGVASITPADSLGAVNVGGVVTLAKYGNINHAVLTKGLAVAGRLDLGDNNLVVDYADASPMEAIRGRIISGYGSGPAHWIGDGITASAARENPLLRVGYAEASDVLDVSGGTATFLNQKADASTILVRITLGGDANLDGAVGFPDLVKVAQNYDNSSGTATWSQGDFDYDGNVGFSDLVVVAQNYDGVLGGAPASAGVTFAQDLRAAFATVPEPGVGGLVIAGGLMIAGGRRRRAKA
jgi:fibronectin-binding autotransporter adhesin